MPAKYTKKTVNLVGQVTVEEAEELSNWLKKTPGAAVKVSQCDHIHAAVLQVLLALAPSIRGEPADPWLRAVLAHSPGRQVK